MKRILSIACAAMLAMSLSSCSSNNSDAADYSNSTITGRVTEISDNSVTLELGELNQDSAAPPDKPEDGAAPSDMPNGERGEQTETPGEGQPGPMNGFTANGETAAIDISSATIASESGSDSEKSVVEINVNDIIVVEVGENNSAKTITIKNTQGGGNPPDNNFGGSGEVTQGSSANTIDQDGTYSQEEYTSAGDDENALRIDGASAALSDITVNKSDGASSNTEDGDFYGQNAALLATNGAQVTIKDSTILSSAQNGNGVFSYGESTTVNISDSSITTTADNSGGIQTTGGAATNAENLTIETSGNSSAAIRSDRGGGTVNVDSGTYTSSGYNSPAIYSTADITVKNAALTAKNSEALVIEGANSISLENCEVTGNMSDENGSSSDENVHNVMIYQSMSGDADVGTSTFSMTGGSLTSNNGDMFYITNTHCILTLADVEIASNESDGYLMRVSGNSASKGWGSAGSNGAQVEFTANNQELNGDIVVDSISALDMTLADSSTFNGTINIIDNAEKGTAVSDNAVITIEKGSTWNLTGDCTVTELTNNGTINFNGCTITLADGTILSE